MRLLQTDIRRALKAAENEDAAAEAARAKAVLEGHGPGGDLRKLLKQPTPALLRMLLGPKVNVVTLQVPRPSPPGLVASTRRLGGERMVRNYKSRQACKPLVSAPSLGLSLTSMPCSRSAIHRHVPGLSVQSPQPRLRSMPCYVFIGCDLPCCPCKFFGHLLVLNAGLCPAQRKAAIGLKEEYHAFRDRSGVILFTFAALLLVGLSRADARRKAGEPLSLTPPLMVGAQLFLTWLLYFYTAMALRENVLKARPMHEASLAASAQEA